MDRAAYRFSEEGTYSILLSRTVMAADVKGVLERIKRAELAQFTGIALDSPGVLSPLTADVARFNRSTFSDSVCEDGWESTG